MYFAYDELLWYVKKCFGHPEDVEFYKILEKRRKKDKKEPLKAATI